MIVARILVSKLPQLVIVLLGVTLVTFVLLNLLPGNVAVLILGDDATPAAIAQLTQEMGLDRPILVRYVEWLLAALQGDFGQSVFNGQSVWDAVMQRVPVTLELLVLALGMAILFAIPAAIISARKPGGIADRTVGIVAFALLSTPNFIAGLLLVLLFAVTWQVLPASGWVPFEVDPIANLQHAILPAIALAATPFAFFTRLLRGDMIEQLSREDYVVTAKAKGVSSQGILLQHVLRNSMFPMLTMVALSTGLLVGGAVVVENIFGIAGVGQLLVQGIQTRDVTIVLGAVVFVAVAVVLANLVIDVAYGVLDPRVRHDRNNG